MPRGKSCGAYFLCASRGGKLMGGKGASDTVLLVDLQGEL